MRLQRPGLDMSCRSLFILLCLLLPWQCHLQEPGSAAHSCFCQVAGYLDDCTCDVETIDGFNNKNLFPKLQKLLETDYFRYYKVNLKKPCPFWNDSHHCGIRDCAVQPCPTDAVPHGIKSPGFKTNLAASYGLVDWWSPVNTNSLRTQCYHWMDMDRPVFILETITSEVVDKPAQRPNTEEHSWKLAHRKKYTETANTGNGELECEKEKRLGAVDESLTEAAQEAFSQWNQHDDSSDDNFCELDDEESPDTEYVDLLINPERFTGYKGADAWKIWNSIYEENCFKPKAVNRPLNPLASARGENDETMFYSWLEGLCVEKRAFYRLISGLHASINIHLSARYLLQDTWMNKIWGHNVTEFQTRFDATLTQNEGPRRLKNLYFIYLIELRAISKVLPFFERQSFLLYTGNKTKDLETKKLLIDIVHDAKDFPLHFDENSLFAGDKKQADRLKEDFRQHFRNISRIMDCVGCFKCRLWGKLQTQGLGTALKILFSEKQIQNMSGIGPSYGFHLKRQEIVALLNAFGRISTSIKELENFKRLLQNL